jgi:hypothetical protein
VTYSLVIELEDDNVDEPLTNSYVFQIYVPGNKTVAVATVVDTNTTQSDSNDTSSTDETNPEFEFGYNPNELEDVEPPYFKSISATNQGKVTIKFSEMFAIPPNLTAFLDEGVMTVELEAYNSFNQDFVGFTWNVTDFTPFQFVI